MGEIARRRRITASEAIPAVDIAWVEGMIQGVTKDLVLRPKMDWTISYMASIATLLITDDTNKVPILGVELINAPRDPDNRRIVMWANVSGLRELASCDSKEPVHFGIAHENKHVGNFHMSPSEFNFDNWKSQDQRLIIAQEANINWEIMDDYGMELPSKGGKSVVVDPEAVHRSYVDACKKEGRTPLSKANFLRSEHVMYSELCALSKPPQRQAGKACHTSTSAPEGPAQPEDGENGGSGAPMDREVVSDVMESVYAAAVKAAEAGDKSAERELQDKMEQHPEFERMWSSVGADRLRSRTSRSRKASSIWMRHVKQTVASKLGSGHRWVWNRRTPWEDRFAPRGRMPKKSGAVFIDSSGSMPQEIIDKVAGLVGKVEGVDIDWHWFDARVGPFVPGGEILGGGGTSFQAIEDHVAGHSRAATSGRKTCCRRYPDFVLVLTDGYAPEVTPSRPRRWVWLIIPQGDYWPESSGMSTHRVDI